MPTRYSLLAIALAVCIGGCQQQVNMNAHVPTPRALGQDREGRLVIRRPQLTGDKFRKHWVDVAVEPPQPFQRIDEGSERAAAMRAAVNDLTTPAYRPAYDAILKEGVSAMPLLIERWEIHEKGIPQEGTPSAVEGRARHHSQWGDIDHFTYHSSSAVHCADLHDTGVTVNYFLTQMVMFHSNYADSREPLPTTAADWKQWLTKNGRSLLIYYPGQHRVRMPFKIHSGEPGEDDDAADGEPKKPAAKTK